MKTEPGEECRVTVPLETISALEGQMPAFLDPPMLCEEVSTTVVTTSASRGSVGIFWARIAANAKKLKAVPSNVTSGTYGEMWYVVHGTSLPATSSGWVPLQFPAGQAWVPGKKGKAIALLLLPVCTFPPPPRTWRTTCCAPSVCIGTGS